MRINITADEMEKFDIPVNDPNFSEIAVNYTQDNYFNWADIAVIYMGYWMLQIILSLSLR